MPGLPALSCGGRKRQPTATLVWVPRHLCTLVFQRGLPARRGALRSLPSTHGPAPFPKDGAISNHPKGPTWRWIRKRCRMPKRCFLSHPSFHAASLLEQPQHLRQVLRPGHAVPAVQGTDGFPPCCSCAPTPSPHQQHRCRYHHDCYYCCYGCYTIEP